jgi:hypothetical protein
VPGKAAWLASDLPFEGDKGPGTRAGAVVDRKAPTCGLADKVGDVAGAGEPVVVVEQDLVLGVLAGDSLVDGSRTAAEAMRPGPSTFRPSIPSDELAAWLDEHDRDHALLTTLDGRLVGVVRRDALR